MSDADKADLLYGMAAIADHLGIDRRQAEHLKEVVGLPTFKLAGKVCARKTSIAGWIAEQEHAGRASQ